MMANLRILMMPNFENYSCHFCGHKLDFRQFSANHIASAHLGCSADHLRDLLLDSRLGIFPSLGKGKHQDGGISKPKQGKKSKLGIIPSLGKGIYENLG